MFSLNKASRSFLVNNDSAIQNGFINDGLIEHKLSLNYAGYRTLEKLYFEALKRNMGNRILTISILGSQNFD